MLDLAKEQGKEIPIATSEDYQRLNNCMITYMPIKKALTYGIYTSAGKLVASCILLFSHNRVYYILAGNHPAGRTMGASQLLINSFKKDHAERERLPDFEGSDIRRLAFL